MTSPRQRLPRPSARARRPDAIEVVCGFLGCNLADQPLPAAPGLRPSARAAGADRLRQLIDFAVTESRENRAGRDCVLLRISELIFVEMVRRYLAALPAEETGCLAALRDAVVGRALALLHERPSHWTLEILAARGRALAVRARRALRALRGPAADAIPQPLAPAAGAYRPGPPR